MNQPRDPIGQFAGVTHSESDLELTSETEYRSPVPPEFAAAAERLLNEQLALQKDAEQLALRCMAIVVRADHPDARYLNLRTDSDGYDRMCTPELVRDADGNVLHNYSTDFTPAGLHASGYGGYLTEPYLWREAMAGHLELDDGTTVVDLEIAAAFTAGDSTPPAQELFAAADELPRTVAHIDRLAAKVAADAILAQHPDARYLITDCNPGGPVEAAGLVGADGNLMMTRPNGDWEDPDLTLLDGGGRTVNDAVVLTVPRNLSESEPGPFSGPDFVNGVIGFNTIDLHAAAAWNPSEDRP